MTSLLSASLLFIAATMVGTGVKNRYKKHCALLDGFYKLLVYAEREIVLERPITEILVKFSAQCPKEFRPVLEKMCERMNCGEHSAEKLSPLFDKKERAAIEDFMRIGTRVGVEESKVVGALISSVKEYLAEAEKAVEKEGKMYFRLCVIAGVALMILVA